MFTIPQAIDIQCALMAIRLQHRGPLMDETGTYALDCACSRCECVDELIFAILAFTETDTP